MLAFLKEQFILYKKPQPPIVPICIFCYHKVGTKLLRKVFRKICTKFSWRFKAVAGLTRQIPQDADVVFFQHSLIDLDLVKTPYIGIHFIRDPRDVIVSGYLYHKRCTEEWVVNDRFDEAEPILYPNLPVSQQHRPERWKRDYINSLKHKSYQQTLLDNNESDGLLFELYHYGAWTIESMLDWNYDNPQIKEVRFESVMNNFDAIFTDLFEYIGFSEQQIKIGLRVASKEDLNRKTNRQLRNNPHVSSPNTTKWQQYFTQTHKNSFKNNFGDALTRLGYEKNEQW